MTTAGAREPGASSWSRDRWPRCATRWTRLHGTHPNADDARRDCLLLSFAPDWSRLPDDVRGHLIQHLALPRDDEPVACRPWRDQLLPRHDGARVDLPLERAAPAGFEL